METKQNFHDPRTVPYLRQDYTYADRLCELQLMQSLLRQKSDNVISEIRYINECISTSTYPGIVFSDTESEKKASESSK